MPPAPSKPITSAEFYPTLLDTDRVVATRTAANEPDVNKRVGLLPPVALVDYLAPRLYRGGNGAGVPVKVVDFYDATEPGFDPLKHSALTTLDPVFLCLKTRCIIVNPRPNQPGEYTLEYTTFVLNVTMRVWRDGRFSQAGQQSDAQWYAVKSPEAAAPEWASLQAAPPVANYNFPVKYLLRHPFAGNQLFFETKVAGVLPAPSLADGDANYLRVAREAVPVPAVGGAPQWVAGAQTAAALVYDLGLVYRVKNNIANSTSAPGGNPANYERVSGGFDLQDALVPDTAAKAASVRAVNAGLAAKVSAAASITSAGITTNFATAQEATDASPLGVPVVLRGAQGPLNLYASETIDAATANFGGNELSAGFPPTSTAQNTRITGFSHAGRIVLIPQTTATANVYTLEDVNISGAGRIEVFLLQSGAFPAGVRDVVNLTRIRGTKTAASTAGADSLQTALIIFQGRTDFNQRQLIVNERDCDLTNEVGAIYGGYLTRGSIINRLGNSRAVPAAGFALQVVTSIDAGSHVAFTDAQLISDQRTAADTFAALTYAASIALDFNAATVQTLAATGNVALAASLNVAQLKTKELYITNTTAAAITLGFPAGWSSYPGPAPTGLAAGAKLLARLRSLGTADAAVEAQFITGTAGAAPAAGTTLSSTTFSPA